MRLLHITTSLHTGGAETLIVNLMPRFKALGYEVGVVVFNAERTPLMERLKKECPECKIYCLGHSYYNPWYIVKLIRIMRHYDIVHTHNSSPQLFAAITNIFLITLIFQLDFITWLKIRLQEVLINDNIELRLGCEKVTDDIGTMILLQRNVGN